MDGAASAMTEDEAAVYDRQIRLWGVDAQTRSVPRSGTGEMYHGCGVSVCVCVCVYVYVRLTRGWR
jgi:molybdopterin/thiamine biosynthesis adenylyltransferase